MNSVSLIARSASAPPAKAQMPLQSRPRSRTWLGQQRPTSDQIAALRRYRRRIAPEGLRKPLAKELRPNHTLNQDQGCLTQVRKPQVLQPRAQLTHPMARQARARPAGLCGVAQRPDQWWRG